jgi:hypothetical protein
MKPESANKICFTNKPQTGEQASIRIILLSLISFFLGVAATAFWFHQVAKRQTENLSFQTSSQSSLDQSAASAYAQPSVEEPLPASPIVIAEVKQMIPDYTSVSLEQGTEILRQAALKDFAAAAQEMENRVANAQEELSQAESKTASDQQAAMKHLQQVQTEQAEKLKQIAAQLQAQITALKQLKTTTP